MVTLGNIHCIQRLTFPLLPPMLLVFCSRVTVSANGPSSPGGTESPWRDKQDLVKELGWWAEVGSIKHQYQPVRSKNVYDSSDGSDGSVWAEQTSGRQTNPKRCWRWAREEKIPQLSFYYWSFDKELKVTALLFLNVLFSFPVNLFSKHVSVRFSPPREKSGNLTIWKCAALEEQQLKFPTAFSPRCAHDSCDTVLELCCGWWRGYQLSQLETPQLLDWLQRLKAEPDEKTVSQLSAGMRTSC